MNPVYLHLWLFETPDSVILDWSEFEYLVPEDLFKGSLALDPINQARGVELFRVLVRSPQTSAHWRSLAEWCLEHDLIEHACEFHAIAAVSERLVTVQY